jgi:transcription initiation factor TFIIIB Brf1 subunit/transcription initiation factor TFIIB
MRLASTRTSRRTQARTSVPNVMGTSSRTSRKLSARSAAWLSKTNASITGPEWRAYDADERERTGAPLTAARHDRGLSTEIGHGTDARGNELSGQKRRLLARMRREQTRGRWRSKAERNLAHGLSEVHRLARSGRQPLRYAENPVESGDRPRSAAYD